MIKKYNFKEIEPEILKFWQEKEIYLKAKQKNQGRKKFYYLDGPPYTSGKVHLGTAWGKALRDSFLRFKRMQGIDVWDRAGFDMHGLPTENGVAKKLKLQTKEEIEKYGLKKFQKACKNFCLENMNSMIADFKRIGVWMDFDNPYMSITPEFMEAEWWLVKQAHEKDRLYEGKKCMHWCASCATSLAKHELEYKNVTDKSIFLKFKIKGKNDEFLIIWTTTPWTIPFNMAVMANPKIEYVKAQVGKEKWVLAKALVGIFMNSVVGKEYKIIDEFKGVELKGIKYEHPFSKDIPYYREVEKISPNIHTVVLSEEYVDTSAGSGLVHCAPGCGPEDYEIGKRDDLPIYNELDEQGRFKESMGVFKGLIARKDDKKFIEHLKARNSLVATTEVDHDYAHCWRCHEGVVFRTTDQWFFRVEDLKEKLVELNKKVSWVPKAAFNAFDSWLKNLKDNSITRQRYWGTPVPIWKCENNDCLDYDIIGSFEELKEKAGKLPEGFHRPEIDEITYKCQKCNSAKKRIPDILDVWIDAGTASWTCLDYPKRTDLFLKLFPAEFILEGKDQIRGWFNLLFLAGFLAFEKSSFKAVYMHGFINDAQGRKMSKSLQNYILPDEVINKHGADTLRYYSIGAASPGMDLNYNLEDVQIKSKNLLILWNIQNFVLDLANSMGFNPILIKENAVHREEEEKYIISRMHSAIKEITTAFEEYRLNEAPWIAEKLYFDLSRTYIQLVREKAAYGTEKEKQAVLRTVFDVLLTILKLMSPITPFFTEQSYQNFKKAFGMDEESIHLCEWPKHNEKLINKELEKEMEIAQEIISSVLALREKSQIGLRWPVQEVCVDSPKKEVVKAVKSLKQLIMRQANTKTILLKKIKADFEIKPNYKMIGMHFGKKTAEIVDLIAKNNEKIVKEIKNEKEEIRLSEGVVIKKSFLEINRKIPEGQASSEFSYGTIYMTTKLSASLESEGYSREVIRRVQQLRKDAGLIKKDKIELFIIPSEVLQGPVEEWKDTIAEKTGCKMIFIDTKKEKEYPHSSKSKIKGNSIELWIKKV